MSLADAFERFASFGGGVAAPRGDGVEMTGANFAKLCKECGLVGGKLTTTDVDLIFTQAHEKGKRTIKYAEFEAALAKIAAKKGLAVDEVHRMVTSSAPACAGTRAESGGIVGKLTDTTQYTGSHRERFDESGAGRGKAGRDLGAKGVGSTPAGGGQVHGHGTVDLSTITDRSPCDVRGVPRVSSSPRPVRAATGSPSASPLSPTPPTATPAPTRSPAPTTRSVPAATDTSSEAGSLHALFDRYCALGAREAGAKSIDGPRFAKLCKDGGLVGTKLTPTDVDILFSRAVTKGQRRLDYPQFVSALGLVAEKMKLTNEQIETKLCSLAGPQLAGTAAEESGVVARMTDTTQYTGSHRERFDESGAGRGKAGRDLGAK